MFHLLNICYIGLQCKVYQQIQENSLMLFESKIWKLYSKINSSQSINTIKLCISWLYYSLILLMKLKKIE